MNISPFINKNCKVYNSSSTLEEIKDDLILYSFVVIMDKDKYIGLLITTDVFNRCQFSFMDSLQKHIRVEFDSNLTDTINLMKKEKVPVLPVFRDGKFEGVVIYTDLLKTRESLSENITSDLCRLQDISLINEQQQDEINKRKQIEAELIESGEKLKDAQRLGQMGHWAWDLKKETLEWSDEIFRIFGLAPATFRPSAKAFEATIHPDDLQTFLEQRETMLDEKRRAVIKHRIVKPNGEIRHVEERATTVTDIDGQVIRVIGTVQDITDRIISEKIISDKNYLINSIINNIPDCIYVKDLNGNHLLVNKSCEKISNKQSAEIIGENDSFIFPSDEAEKLMNNDRKIIEKKIISTCKEVLTLPNGEKAVFLSTKGPVFDSDGNVAGIFGISRDITKFEFAEKSLHESQVIFKTAFDMHASLMAITTMEDGKYIDVNNAFCSTLGFSQEEVIGKRSVELNIWTSQGAREEVMNLFKKQGYLSNYEVEYFAKNMEKRYGLFSIASIKINDNALLMTSMTDITEQKKLGIELEHHRNHLEKILEARTKELFESEKRYREIIDTITDYVYQVKIDSENNIQIYHTEACFTVTGYYADEFNNNHELWFSIVYESDREAVDTFFKTINFEVGPNKKIEHRIIHKNGSIRWINNTIILHRNVDRKIIGYDGVIKDITEKKRSENEIKRLNQHIIKLQEEERQKVAQDLHDSVGQTILAAKINIEAYMQNPDRFKNQIDVGLSFLTQASSELREIYTGLYPTVLNDLGLEMAVRLLIANSIETTGIRAEIDIALNTHLSHDINVCLYRIIKEIVSNILKHSQATFMYLSLLSENNRLKLTVKDNGSGFNPDILYDRAAGYGLANIKSRIESYNGTFAIEKNVPTGINIYITLEMHTAN